MDQAHKEKPFDIRDIFSVISRRKWLIIIPFILAGVATYGVIQVLEPKYKASLIIWIDKPSSVSRELINIFGSGRPESRQDQIKRLRAIQNEITSQTYLSQLITVMKMGDLPWVVEQAAKLRSNNPELPVGMLKQQILLGKLRSQIEVSVVATDQIKIAAESTNPREAKDIVTHLAAIMEEEKTKYELDKILDNQNFADEQLERTQFDYQQAIDSLTDAQTRFSELSMAGDLPTEANRRVIIAEIDETDIEISVLTNQWDSLARVHSANGLERPKIRYSQLMSQRRSEIDDQSAKLADMIGKEDVADQEIVQVNIRINNSLNQIKRDMVNLVSEQYSEQSAVVMQSLSEYFFINEQIDILRNKRELLGTALIEMTSRMNQLPRLQAEIDELRRRVDHARKYRDAFKSEEIMVKILSEQARERTKYKVIEPAHIPLSPFWPNKMEMSILGLVLGLIVGAAAAVLAEIMDSSFKTVEEVEEVLGLKVIAVVPKIDKLKVR